MTPAALLLLIALPCTASDLTPEELARRKEALGAWTNEPVALEDQSFLLHLDRRDGSFFFQDRRTGTRWYSAWGRRGFASVQLTEGGPWLPVDRLEGLSAQARRLRFRGASSAGALPRIVFTLESHASQKGVTISWEVNGEDSARVLRVRILDRALWLPDTASGGLNLPVGLGEWIDARDPGKLVPRRLTGLGPAPLESGTVYSAPFLGLYQGENPLLVSWEDPTLALEVTRESSPSGAFPGASYLGVTLEGATSSGKVSLFTLGKDVGGVLDAARGYRDLLGPESFQRSLRFKTGERPELRAALGAAVLRVELGDGERGRDVALTLARRLRQDLRIEEALLLLTGWQEGEPLTALVKQLKETGVLVGLELGLESAGGAPRDPSRREDLLTRLAEQVSPHLVLLDRPELWPGVGGATLGLPGRSAILERTRAIVGLAGVTGGTSLDTGPAGVLLGVSAPCLGVPGGCDLLPAFPAAFGSYARLLVDPSHAVRADQPEQVLAHLLVGEVPLYALPGAGEPLPPATDPRLCFAREEGWVAGKGLAPQEIFLKNTAEVLAQVARLRFREPLFAHRKLNAAGTARESYFGPDLRVVVNFGPGDFEDEEEGFVLPPNGFFVRHPFVRAFHALRMNDVVYERPAGFLAYSLEGKMILRAEEVKLIHLFGPSNFSFGGRTFEVDRERVVKF